MGPLLGLAIVVGFVLLTAAVVKGLRSPQRAKRVVARIAGVFLALWLAYTVGFAVVAPRPVQPSPTLTPTPSTNVVDAY